MGWTLNFKSLANRTCVIEIDGGGTLLKGAPHPIEWQENDSDNLLSVVRFSTGYLRLVEENFGDLNSLYPSKNNQRRVSFFYGESSQTTKRFFKGFVQAQNYDSEWRSGARNVDLPIVSPLGIAAETYFQPIPDYDNVTLGKLLKYVATELEFDIVWFPQNLLTNSNKPLLTQVNPRVISPYNSKYNYGENDIFSPISFNEFLEGFCNLFGLVAHDCCDADGNSVLVFSKFDYSGNWVRILVSNLDTEYSEYVYNQPHTTFENLFTISDNQARISMLQPLGKLTINNGNNLDTVDMTLKLSTLGSHPRGREGTMHNVGKVMYLIPINENVGNMFSSPYYSDDTTYYSTNPGTNMVRVGGTGEKEVIEIIYTGNGSTVDTYLVQYNFCTYPLTDFGLYIETIENRSAFKLQIYSGTKTLTEDSYGHFTWQEGVHTLDAKGPTSDERGIHLDNIPAVTNPVIVRLIPASSTYVYFGDPIIVFRLSSVDNPLDVYLVNLQDTEREIIKKGSLREASIDMLFHDSSNNSNKILNGTTVQNNYDYMFTSQSLLRMPSVKKSSISHNLSDLYRYKISAGGIDDWRLISFGFDPYDDNYSIQLMRSGIDNEEARFNRIYAIFKSIVDSAANEPIPTGGETETYLKAAFNNAISNRFDWYNENIFPPFYPRTVVPELGGSESEALDSLLSWLFAMIFSELCPTLQNSFYYAAYRVFGNPDEQQIFGYPINQDPLMGRIIASILYARMRRGMKTMVENALDELDEIDPYGELGILRGGVLPTDYQPIVDAMPDGTKFMPSTPINNVNENVNFANDRAIFDYTYNTYYLTSPSSAIRSRCSQALDDDSSSMEYQQQIYTAVGVPIATNVYNMISTCRQYGNWGTATMKDGVDSQGHQIVDPTNTEHRERPYVYEDVPVLDPNGSGGTTPDNSYPSGHAAREWNIALMLIEANPDINSSKAIVTRAWQYCQNREIARWHWMSDVLYGCEMGCGPFAKIHSYMAYLNYLNDL